MPLLGAFGYKTQCKFGGYLCCGVWKQVIKGHIPVRKEKKKVIKDINCCKFEKKKNNNNKISH